MKRLMSLFVAVLFAAATAGTISAQTPTTPAPAAPPTEKKMDKAEKKAEKKMAAKNASGTVKSASADSLVVTGKAKGKETDWTFAVDPKTKIKKGGKGAMAADLKAGDAVTVRYMDHEGKMVAQSVNVKGGGMAKDAKPAAEKEKK